MLRAVQTFPVTEISRLPCLVLAGPIVEDALETSSVCRDGSLRSKQDYLRSSSDSPV